MERLFSIFCVLILLVACSTQRAPKPADSNLSALIPIPDPRATKLSGPGLVCSGGNYASGENVNRIGANAEFKVFAGDPFPLAYAIYSFEVGEYRDDPTLRFDWMNEPTDFSRQFVGVANFAKQRWDFFPGNSEGIISFGNFDSYLQNGKLLVVVVVQWPCQAELKKMSIGPWPPVAELTVNPPSGFAPLEVSLDASSSYDPDGGEIASYDWDFDGDGTFELLNGDEIEAYTYTLDGEIAPSVRVTDNQGQQSIAVALVQLGGWTRFYADWDPSIPGMDDLGFTNMEQDPQYNIICSGLLGKSNEAGIIAKFDHQGVYLWGTKISKADYWMEAVRDIGVDGAGNAYGIGLSWNSTSTTNYVIKLASTGELLWQKAIWPSENVGAALAVADGRLYVASIKQGGEYVPGLLQIGCISVEGNLMWYRELDGSPALGEDDLFSSVDLAIDTNGNLLAAATMAMTYMTGEPPQPRMSLHRIDPTGTLLGSVTWEHHVSGGAPILRPSTQGIFLGCRARTDMFSADYFSILSLDSSLNTVWECTWRPPGNVLLFMGDLSLAPDGSLFALTSSIQDILARISPQGSVLENFEWDAQPGFNYTYDGVLPLQNGVLLLGSVSENQPDLPSGSWSQLGPGTYATVEARHSLSYQLKTVTANLGSSDLVAQPLATPIPPDDSNGWAFLSGQGFPFVD